jgi:hypothetical protein
LAVRKVSRRSAVSELSTLLDSPEIAALVAELDALRFVGRKGYGVRALVGACLVKYVYALPTWTRTADLIADHEGLQRVLGAAPSHWALYRFSVKLRAHKPLIDSCLARVAESLRGEFPGIGTDVAIDASDLPAYANGQRYIFNNGPERQVYSDVDASWGHRSAVGTRTGGGFYGYKIDLAACSETGLPCVAGANRPPQRKPFRRAADRRRARSRLPASHRCDGSRVRQQPRHGRDARARLRPHRRASQGRPIPLTQIPYGSPEWKRLYHRRVAVEREFGRLKHEYALAPLRIRGLARVQLHADLCILARLSLALTRARAIPLAA